MELLIHYSLYIIALVCVAIPLTGLGLCPNLVMGGVTTLFSSNIMEQLSKKFKK